MHKTELMRPLMVAVILSFSVPPSFSETDMPNVEYLPGIEWPQPPIVTPGRTNGDPPSDAIVLFGGDDLSAWEGGENWKVEDGMAIVGTGDIVTKQSFGDCQLHIEWSAPQEVRGSGQGRGNSGIFMMDNYEIQVLDSYDNETYYDGQAGAIYKQTPPLVNAMRPPGEWNVYDVVWTAPRFQESGELNSPARVTVLHNGVLILHNFELAGGTYWHEPASYTQHAEKLPIRLQDHLDPVRYRNIWVREPVPIVGRQARPPRYIDHDTGKEWEAGSNSPAAERDVD